jgi:hypothetical protein
MFASGRARTIEALRNRRSAVTKRREIIGDLSVSRKSIGWLGKFKRRESLRSAHFRMAIEHARAEFEGAHRLAADRIGGIDRGNHD